MHSLQARGNKQRGCKRSNFGATLDEISRTIVNVKGTSVNDGRGKAKADSGELCIEDRPSNEKLSRGPRPSKKRRARPSKDDLFTESESRNVKSFGRDGPSCGNLYFGPGLNDDYKELYSGARSRKKEVYMGDRNKELYVEYEHYFLKQIVCYQQELRYARDQVRFQSAILRPFAMQYSATYVTMTYSKIYNFWLLTFSR